MHQEILTGKGDFLSRALENFAFQKEHNAVYAAYLDAIRYTAIPISLNQIPFLPISFFKTQQVVAAAPPFDKMFKSSGTTTSTTSQHHVKDLQLYIDSFKNGFQQFYGDAQQYCILGLLPSYLEQGDSSLVFMVQQLIENSDYKQSRTFLNQLDDLHRQLQYNSEHSIPTILIGVTYALLDFAEIYPMALPDHIIIMETGGMKGRRVELTRSEVHRILMNSFQKKEIHSEYGMTELLSQAYSKGDGIYICSPSMKVLVREINDPFSVQEKGRGVLNIIDISNYYSCSFIATDDLGEVLDDGSFYVSGRLDSSDMRGCSLLAL